MKDARIAELRREYRSLHERVLTLHLAIDNPDVSALQAREYEIVSELRRLGAGPYETVTHIAAGRAC